MHYRRAPLFCQAGTRKQTGNATESPETFRSLRFFSIDQFPKQMTAMGQGEPMQKDASNDLQALLVPFGFRDERLRKSWIDVIRRVPPALLVEAVKQRHRAAKITAGPVEHSYVLPLAESSFFAALTSDDRPVILWVTRRSDEFAYDVGHYLLESVP